MNSKLICPKCLSENVQKRGRQVLCNDCKKYSLMQESLDLLMAGRPSGLRDANYLEDGKVQSVSAKVPRKMNDKDLLRYLEIDEKEWKVAKVKYGRLPIYRKDKSSSWESKNGKGDGWSEDTGKLLVEYVYSVQVWLEPRVEENRAEAVVNGLLKRLAKSPHKTKTKKYRQSKDGLLLEVMIPDIHIGRMTFEHESGENYNVELAEKVVSEAVESMLAKVDGLRIQKILFPLGNDFYNADNHHGTTAAGTPQQEHPDFVSTFLSGERVMSMVVDRLTDVAPVDLMFIPGNHDPHRLFYLSRVAKALYSNDKNVNVSEGIKERQYYNFGSNLFCFTHGDKAKLERLPLLMSIEAAKWWAKARVRECHMGHFHHKKDMEYMVLDGVGITFRHFRSLTAADLWHFGEGFVGSPKAAECLAWTPSDGLYGQYPAMIHRDRYVN